MCYNIKKNKRFMLLEMSDKCINDECPTSEKGKGNNSNH
jgi:hypothetical protein